MLGTTVADAAGAYAFTPSSPLADGVHSITATVTGTAGNTSAATAPFALTVDTAAPAVSAPVLDAGSDSGVQGDGRTYGHPIVLRPVSSEDAMTADWTRLPYDVLARISNRITNEVREVNRVVLDVTSKPPGTIEWE